MRGLFKFISAPVLASSVMVGASDYPEPVELMKSGCKILEISAKVAPTAGEANAGQLFAMAGSCFAWVGRAWHHLSEDEAFGVNTQKIVADSFDSTVGAGCAL